MRKPHGPHNGRSQRDNIALEYILLGDLRDLLEEPFNNETRRWLLAVLGSLLDTMPNDGDGDSSEYLGEVLEEYPNWSRQVDNLHRERELLYAELDQYREQIQQRDNIEEVAQRLQNELRRWMATLEAHKRHETRLLQMAYTLEIGAGD